MGFRFRKSVKIGKNTRLNLSKSGIGLSTGVKGARVSVNQKGTRTTLSAPGTGLSYTSYRSHGENRSNNGQAGIAVQYPNDTIPFLKGRYYSPFLLGLTILNTILFLIIDLKVIAFIFGAISIWLTRVIRSDVNKAYKLYNKALKTKNEDEKVKLLKEAKGIDNSNDLVNSMLAYIYFNKQDNNSTIQFISDINDFSKLNAYELERMLIISLFENKEYGRIISNYESEIEADLFKKLIVGLSYKELGKVKKASEILATGPVNKRTYDDAVLTFKYYLGICYMELGDKQKAERQLKKVYEVNSSFEDVVSYVQELGFAVGEHL